MKANEFVIEAKTSVKDQIIADVRRDGGASNEYFVRFGKVDQLGYSTKQVFGRSPDMDDPKFDADYIGAGAGRPALWFYPLNFYLKNDSAYGIDQPYAWLVRLRPTAWLQSAKPGDRGIKPAPPGKQRVGIMRQTQPPAAIFFRPEFDVIGKYYDYGSQHQTHGQVKGAIPPSFFDRVRGPK